MNISVIINIVITLGLSFDQKINQLLVVFCTAMIDIFNFQNIIVICLFYCPKCALQTACKEKTQGVILVTSFGLCCVMVEFASVSNEPLVS
jgi:hypothetical protein